MKNSNLIVIALFTLMTFTTATTQAQGYLDGFFSEQGALAVTTSYTRGSFDTFYFGKDKKDLKDTNAYREITQDIYDIYAKYEVAPDLVAFLNIPFIVGNGELTSNAEVGTKKEVSGIQDVTLGLKYRIKKFKYENSRFSILSAFSVSLPGDYEPNGILSIGNGAVAADISTGVHYDTDKGFFTTLFGSYSFRDDHQDHGDFNVPSAFIGTAKIGYANRNFYVDGWFEFLNSVNGLDISQADFGNRFPETRVMYSRVGGTIYKKFNEEFGMSLGAGTILNGRNVGKATTFTIGLTYEVELL